MKTNLNLRKEIEGKFNLNEIQRQATEKIGKNLIFDAPTASGKTEAILLSIEEGSNVTWMLPTISACTFMYRRLCHDFENLNVKVSTSTMEETRFVKEGLTRINIITCDPFMVEYMKEYVTNNVFKQTTDEVLVLDEIDNYPAKVRTALKHYMKNVPLKQVVLASATLDDELKESKEDFELIQFSKVSNKIRYKSLTLDGYRQAVIDVVKPNYRKKRIGVISNCVKYMENMKDIIQEVMGVNCEEDMNVIYHHSSLPNEIKFENERRLFEGEYDLLISNDLVSMSVDVDLDILIMDWSDKMNVNIQRMGRLNRKGKRVTFKNLFIIDDGVYPPFIKRDMAEYLLEDLELEEGSSRIITSNLISEWSERISLEDYSFDTLIDDVRYAIKHDEEILLRDVPLVFRYEEIRTVQKRKKGKKIEAERKLMTVDKRMNSIPWVWDTPCSEEDGEKDLVYMPWLYEVDHPSGEHSSVWLIVSYDQENGIRTIVPYDGPQYEYYGDVDDEDEYIDENRDRSNSSEFTVDNCVDGTLDIKHYEEDQYHLECDPVYVNDYSNYGYSSLHTLEEVKRIITNLLRFSNTLSEKQKWSPFSNLNIIMRRANMVLDNVISNYYIEDTDVIMKSVATLLNNNPELEKDKLISVLFYIDKEEEKLYMKKSWLGLAKIVKQFIIEEIEKKVENFNRSLLSISQTKYIVEEYDGNHIVRGIEYDDELYLFSSYPNYFEDYIAENNLNIIEDVREESNGYSRKGYFPLNNRTMNALMWNTKYFILGQYNI